MLKTIQAGRGLAALAVCAFHLSIFFADKRYLGYKVLDNLTGLGYLGVDFFFVLSGFIIMYAHQADLGQPQRLKAYALKRFVRLFPVYWLYTIGYTALVLVGIGAVASVPNGIAEWFSTFSLIRLSAFHPPLHPAWTLFHEVAFYGVFATLIWNKKWGALVFAIWVVVIACVFQYAPESQRTPFSTYFSAYNLDFIVGIAAYYLWKRGRQNEGYMALMAGFFIILAIVIIDPKATAFIGTPFAYATAFGALLAGSVIWETHKGEVAIPLATLIGNASYTIYLTHEPVMGVFVKVFLSLNKALHLPVEVIYLMVFVMTISGCCLVYRFVETPVINRFKAWLLPATTRAQKPAEST